MCEYVSKINFQTEPTERFSFEVRSQVHRTSLQTPGIRVVKTPPNESAELAPRPTSLTRSSRDRVKSLPSRSCTKPTSTALQGFGKVPMAKPQPNPNTIVRINNYIEKELLVENRQGGGP